MSSAFVTSSTRRRVGRQVEFANKLLCFFHQPPTVLSIHKRPTTTSSNFTFPMKGWRGMLDWVRTSEEKISVSRDALSIDTSGKGWAHISHVFA